MIEVKKFKSPTLVTRRREKELNLQRLQTMNSFEESCIWTSSWI